ncbi:hypothetical protein FOA43_001406 [Brettanomyces nanus]|uniref:Peptidase M20 dimerisation domain-containing protein n=1 Tax=Eeniella nana TaxID=13502 RepID=A0A875S177_EENNA|nr:uncharacterized protein FOA43_001406 [Brettanomyces nanus]QPG74085.1 hypothetical protein FOA43_001406 [Brettanomyces nanus]
MSVESTLKPLFSQIDSLKPNFIERLRHAVSIPSVSGDEDLRPSVIKMGEFLKSELEKLGADEVQLKHLGTQSDAIKKGLALPPVVVSRFGRDPTKKTVLVYGHYDVQPAFKEDGWNTEPFEMVEKDGKLLGRGSTDDKGPVIGWLNVLEAHRAAGIELPINLITCFEGMEESGSIGLDQLIHDEADKFFKGVDVVCICDNYWLGTKKPVLTYGLRGVNYYQMTVEGPAADLHSGIFGGIVYEPMTDLIKVMSQLVDEKGNILIPGINDMVAPLTSKEEDLYKDIDYDVEELGKATGAEDISVYQNKKDILMHRWRYPSLSLHGIEGAFSGAGAKTVIPAKVSGKFSIRTVPDMESEKLTKLVYNYSEKVFAELHSPNKFSIVLVHDGDYWLSNPFNEAFTAAKNATKLVWGVEPDFIREGGSIPITLTFENELKTSAVLLPMGKGDDGAHSINEKLDIKNYIEGIKTMSAYLHFIDGHPRNYKYTQYFNNLNYDGRMFEKNGDSATAKYYKSHRVYRPQMMKGEENSGHMGLMRSRFNSFINVPSVFSDTILTGLAYHAGLNLGPNVYLLGGLQCLTRQKYETYLCGLTKNFSIPPQNVTIKFDYDLPLPLTKDKLINLASIPNSNIYKYSSESNTMSKVMDTTNCDGFSPLLCSAVAAISESSFITYGGLQLHTSVTYPDSNHAVVERKLIPSNDFWMFDSRRISLRPIRISVHPTYSANDPIAIARFGHKLSSVTLEQNNEVTHPHHNDRVSNLDGDNRGGLQIGSSPCSPHQSSPRFSKPALVLVMGGYRTSDSSGGSQSFVAMNDLWKCEIFFNRSEFSDEAICCPIGNFDLISDKYSYMIDDQANSLPPITASYHFGGVINHYNGCDWPKPRGFFTMELIERPDVAKYYNQLRDSSPLSSSSVSVESPVSPMSLSSPISAELDIGISASSDSSSPNESLYRHPVGIPSVHAQFPSRISTSQSNKSNALRSIATRMSSSSGSQLSSSRNTSISALSYGSPTNPSEGAHTHKNKFLGSRMLIIYGGSSTVYTRLVSSDGCRSHFSWKEMLGDVWWFDFQSERWKKLDTYYEGKKVELKVCGHDVSANNQHMMMLGGLQPNNIFGNWGQVKDIIEKEDPRQVIDSDRLQKCRKLIEIYRQKEESLNTSITDKMGCIGFHPLNKSTKTGEKFSDSRGYYTSFVLNLETCRWEAVDFLFVKRMRAFLDGKSNMLYACSPMMKLDSKLILFGGDVRKIDVATHKERSDDCQNIYGGNIMEVYSPFLKI